MSKVTHCSKNKGILRFFILAILSLVLTLTLAFLFLPHGKEEGKEKGSIAEKDFVLYLDAGHGGFDTGAVATLGDGKTLAEKDLVLALALDAASELRALGYTVHLSRKDDRRHTYTTSADEVYARRADAAARGTTLLLSIHANAYAGEGRAFGARVYYHPSYTDGARIATLFADAITRETAALSGRDARAIADGSYAILGDKSVPALLFECGFLSDPAECALLADEGYRAHLVRGVVAGIEAIRLSSK